MAVVVFGCFLVSVFRPGIAAAGEERRVDRLVDTGQVELERVGIQRVSTGTNVPCPRTWRSIEPRSTVPK